MQVDRKPLRIVEIDVDQCIRTYGSSPCTASLSLPGQPRKCYNTFNTCQDKENFQAGTLTLRFVEPRVDIPLITNAFPVLESVSPVTATVNIAGTNDKYNGLGRRGTISATLTDFPYGDQVTDKYASERKSGSAQLDEGGYDPKDRGTFFGKLKSRWPTYGDRPMRFIEGYIDESGAFVAESTRHYILTDFEGPDRSGKVVLKGKDILHLADDKKALCPKPSRGQLQFELFPRFDNDGNINPQYDPEIRLTPAGIGAEYPTKGYAVIGREVVTYTRSGDIVTLTGRGLENTEEKSHREGSTFQQAYRVVNTRIDDLVEDLLINFGNIPSSFIPKADWTEEITRWASTLFLDTVITKPEGVSKLLSEISILGVSIWWDDVDQEIKLKVNAPPFIGETVVDWGEDNSVLDISQSDHDEDRLTQVHFYSVQTDPTGSATEKNNFDRIIVAIDAEAEQQNSYRNPRIREIFCRWVNRGADSVLLVSALRMLARFNTAPITYKVKIDNKDNDISLVDVVRLNTRVTQDVTGKPSPKLTQVREKSTRREHGWTDIVLQDFFFKGEFRFIAPNDTPVYGSATQGDKDTFAFMIAEDDLFFPDGAPAHQLI